MPRGDGTGPSGGGPGTGRGMGQSGGRGSGNGNRPGAGPGGDCVCSGCGMKIVHQAGLPCYSINCPKCGMKMARG